MAAYVPKIGEVCSPAGHAIRRMNMSGECVPGDQAYADIKAHIGKACSTKDGVRTIAGTFNSKGACSVNTGPCEGKDSNYFYTYDSAGYCTKKGAKNLAKIQADRKAAQKKLSDACKTGGGSWSITRTNPEGLCMPGSTLDPGPSGSLGPTISPTSVREGLAPNTAAVLDEIQPPGMSINDMRATMDATSPADREALAQKWILQALGPDALQRFGIIPVKSAGVGGIPTWMFLAGGAAALFLFMRRK